MPSYSDLMNQAQALMAQAEQVRKQELASVITEIKNKMKEYGITLADLGGATAPRKPAGKSKSKSTAPAKYRGPNGETWAGGLGRKPEWVRAILAAGKNLEDYRI